MAKARFIWPEPDSTAAPNRIGTAGAGTPACTANAQPKSTTTPYSTRTSGIDTLLGCGSVATRFRRDHGSSGPWPRVFDRSDELRHLDPRSNQVSAAA